jgi:N,N'-diacetyllegionaminate synthase
VDGLVVLKRLSEDLVIGTVEMGDRVVGEGSPCCVIAEAGVNHNGNMDLAHQLIDSAKAAGADAIKFQSYRTEELITAHATKAAYQVATTGESESQYGMLKALELTGDQQAELKTHCDHAGVLYLCTPYDSASVEMLHRLDVAAFKVASTDTTNIPMLRQIARKGRPVLLSTGMSTLDEVQLAVTALRAEGLDGRLVLLQCTSEYPAPMDEVNLRAMHTMREACHCPVGFSDHTAGLGASPWAVALGACVVEKHFTLDRSLPGPDHRASLIPSEMAELVNTIRRVEMALGDGIKRPMPSELGNKAVMQKSVVARRPIPAGHFIQAEDLACKRPATGLSPAWFDRVVGKRTRNSMSADHIIEMADIEWNDGEPL